MKQLHLEAQFIGVWIVYNNFIVEFIITFFSASSSIFKAKTKQQKKKNYSLPSAKYLTEY